MLPSSGGNPEKGAFKDLGQQENTAGRDSYSRFAIPTLWGVSP